MRSSSLACLAVLFVACGGGNAPPDPKSPEAKPAPSITETVSPPASSSTTAKTDEPPKPAPTEDTSFSKEDVKRSNEFALETFARFVKTHAQTDAMLSGTSLRQALAGVYFGANASTKREMAQVLGLAEDTDAAAKSIKGENANWDAAHGANAELLVANRIWVDKATALDPAYGATAQSIGVDPAFLEIVKKPEDARKTINAWVSEKTKEKIHELLPPGSIDARSRLVITNAIYFKGRWSNPFPKNATKDEKFSTLKAGTSVTVPTMHLIDSFRYGEDKAKGVTLLELRYEGSELGMLVVLPDTKDGLPKVEAALDANTLDRWASSLQTTRVDVALPKLGFRTASVMSPLLQEMGMKSAFTDKADFSKMADAKEKLSIGPVFHQTWIALDETGTEAAAATGAVMRTTSLMVGEPKPFKADHPFLFFIRDTKRGRVLFTGRVVSPTPPKP